MLLLEPEQAVRQDTMRGQLLSGAFLDGAQIFAHYVSIRPDTFERHDGQHFICVVTNIRTLGCRHALRNPEQSEKAHDMVDAQTSPMPECGSDGFAERAVRRGAQLVWDI